MPKFIDRTGLRYGKVIVLKRAPKSGKKVLWICQCDCGEIFTSRCLSHKERIKSCGCDQKLSYGIASMKALYRNYKRAAKIRGYKYQLSIEEFHKITSNKCFYCGSEPGQIFIRSDKNANGAYLYNGIDRLDNNKGYTYENCVPCCWICNRAKGELTQIEFLIWIKKLISHWLEAK